ncbi:uncharacterized protein LOC134816011 isoform X3 [Bolinopsis microptera]|uniref:uncharacterized protein LOC134816011 isoform X3 n=1 Tax=Bolinopsis microptera TaxID=2820187 RepID=UPI00307A8CC6
MLLLLVVLVLVASVQSNEDDKGYNALHFGTSTSDYVTFSFHMSPFRNSFSTCMWIKHLHSSAQPTVVSYYSSAGNDLTITANGHWTHVVNDGGLDSAKSKFTTPAGQWFSLCLTWSLSSTTSNLYLNGELIGTDQTASGKSLTTGAQLWLGRTSSSWTTHANYVFGGDLYQYNMFAEVLSAATIKKIADGGLCFDLDELAETRVLRWEDILKKSRSGSVSEVMMCPWKKKFTESQASLADAIGRLNETETELRMVKEQFQTVTGQLNRTEDKLEKARKFENITRWDVLYTSPYYNKVFSDDLYEQLTTSWGLLRKLVGANMTDGVVNHFRQYHSESMCGVLDQLASSWEMLSQFIGVEMTRGIVDHFKISHNGSECGNNTES